MLSYAAFPPNPPTSAELPESPSSLLSSFPAVLDSQQDPLTILLPLRGWDLSGVGDPTFARLTASGSELLRRGLSLPSAGTPI